MKHAKLTETFSGQIQLNEKPPVFVPSDGTEVNVPNKKKDTLQNIKDNSTEMFVQSLFPDKFKDIVSQCFLDNNAAFQKLFNDPEFYQQVQDEIAKDLYKSLRKE